MDDIAGAPDEHWLKRWWRPAMAIQYILVCLFDFIIFPGLYAAIFAAGGAFHEWHPLTLSNGGLYHAAMGAIVGVVAYQRTQEKLAALNSGTTIERTTERSSVSSTAPTQTDQTTTVETRTAQQTSGRAD